MKSDFEVGKCYKCISTCGASPTFEEVGNTMNCVSLFKHMTTTIYIETQRVKEDGRDRRAYMNEVIDFKVGSHYTVVSLNPLTLYGDVRFPALDPSEKVKKACTMLQAILCDSNLQYVKSVAHAIVNAISWHVERQWDGSEEALKNILCEEIKHLVLPYSGSDCGYASMEERKHFILSLLTPHEYNAAVALPPDVIPSNIFIKWKKGEPARVMVYEDTTLTQWYKHLIAPL